MAKTFDENLGSDRDWVRFLIGDSVVASMNLDDETIDAVLAETSIYPNRYCAAAECARSILGLGKDVIKKKVDGLEIEKAGDDPESAYRDLIRKLDERGAELLMPKPRAFRVL